MAISMEQIKDLRAKTGAGVMDCKKALQEVKGDVEKAVEFLREKGIAAAVKKSGRVAQQGQISSYIHMGGKIGVLLEVNCETDFVARTDKFQELVHNLALQIAAANPLYVSREDVPAEEVEKERSILKQQALNEKKPERVIDQIVEGRIEKYFQDVCLLEQPYIREPELTIKEMVLEHVSQLGENIIIRRFARFEVGEELTD